VATINNQKAVLKVGTDEFFVTNVATTTTTSTVTSQQSPTVTTAPFFSGILLDVTPRIDHDNRIMLHIHPSVSTVTESRKEVALGANIPSIVLPLPRSTVSETDTIVSIESDDNRGGIPGLNIDLLRTTDRRIVKKELVILLKPTVIGDDADWDRDLRESQDRLRGLFPREERK
jgi:MSHA biogenesis protein MshL